MNKSKFVENQAIENQFQFVRICVGHIYEQAILNIHSDIELRFIFMAELLALKSASFGL